MTATIRSGQSDRIRPDRSYLRNFYVAELEYATEAPPLATEMGDYVQLRRIAAARIAYDFGHSSNQLGT